MDCRRAKGLILSEYADGLLRGHALEELESHTRSCSSCRRLAEGVTKAGELFKSAVRADAPQGVWNRIRADLAGLSADNESAAEGFLDRIRYGLYRLRPAVMAAAAVIILLFALATARLVSYMNYSADVSAREDMINMVSLNGEGAAGDYDIGTSVEAYFL